MGANKFMHSEPDLDLRDLWAGVEYVDPEQAAEKPDWASSGSYEAGFEFKGSCQRGIRPMFEFFRRYSPEAGFSVNVSVTQALDSISGSDGARKRRGTAGNWPLRRRGGRAPCIGSGVAPRAYYPKD